MHNRNKRDNDFQRDQRQGSRYEREGRFEEPRYQQQRFSGRYGDYEGDRFGDVEPHYGQGRYNQERFDQEQHGQGRYNQGRVDQEQYGQGRYAQERFGQGQFGQERYGQNWGRGQNEPWSGRDLEEGGMGRNRYGLQGNYGHEGDINRGQQGNFEGGIRRGMGVQGNYGFEDDFGRGQQGGMAQFGQTWGQRGLGQQRWGQQGVGQQGWDQQGMGQQGLGQQGGSMWGQQDGNLGSLGQRGSRGPRGYKRSDQRIHEDICDCLMQQNQIDASDIEVKVQNGEVTLTGTVEQRHIKHMVENLVDSIPGVQDVENQLRIKRLGQERTSGQERISDQERGFSTQERTYGQQEEKGAQTLLGQSGQTGTKIGQESRNDVQKSQTSRHSS